MTIVPNFVPTPAQAAAIEAGLLLTPQAIAERNRILAARYFLVRQGSLGEIFRCGRCKQKHAYLTLMCCEQPFSGIDGGLFAFYKVLGRPGAIEQMRPEERGRFERVKRLFRPVNDLPELSAVHPGMAQAVSRLDQLSQRDAMIGSIALGVLEPITQDEAQRLLTRINTRGGKLTVPGLMEE